jgi:hypothetical protein
MLAKALPKIYGEKQQVEHTGGVNITVVDGYSDTA